MRQGKGVNVAAADRNKTSYGCRFACVEGMVSGRRCRGDDWVGWIGVGVIMLYYGYR
jgi:hypothetical protein